MKLLFIQGGTRFKKDDENNWYTDGNFNEKIWERYQSYCGKLTVITREESKIFEKKFAEKNFNKTLKSVNIIAFKDLYSPKRNFFNFKLRKEIKKIMTEEIKESDFIVIRSITNYYTLLATKICKKLKKKYLIEVTGVAFDALWYHGDLFGKILAIPIELKKRFYMKKAPYALYVTNEYLQKVYKCDGETIGCSDVEIEQASDEIIKKRLEKINKLEDCKKLTLGTLAWINLKTKGQKDVIKAMAILKKNSNIIIEYQLVGGGDSKYLSNIAKKYGVEDQVKFIGQKPHNEVFEWLDNIDIYIQPSYQEGLCRAVIEAMSRGCPIICSNAGGNNELAAQKYIFKRKKIKEITKIISNITKNDLIIEAKRSFEKSKEYDKTKLDLRRNDFYRNSMNK